MTRVDIEFEGIRVGFQHTLHTLRHLVRILGQVLGGDGEYHFVILVGVRMVLARPGIFLGDILLLDTAGPIRDTKACGHGFAVTADVGPEGGQGLAQLCRFLCGHGSLHIGRYAQ